MRARIRLATLCLMCAAVLGSCGSPGGKAKAPVGDMGDDSYWNARDLSRPNAEGGSVTFGEYAGRFVWADYAAPWCSPCKAQSRSIRSVEQSFDQRDVVFLTVMTSEMGGYGHPATPETAARWARRFRLDPKRVLAADLTAITIPRHLLFSPQGQLLFFKTGQMPGAEIRATLSGLMRDWREWSATGKRFDWMR